MKFHEKLKQERKKLNLSQEDLANKINISRQSISKWELEKGYPNIETLIELSELFDITVDELLKGDDFLKDKIVEDGKKLKHPLLFNLGEVIGLLGIIILISNFVLRGIRLATHQDILPFLQSNLVTTIAIIFLLISWLTYETFGKSYK
ncbi:MULTISPECIES: helix-turn-helix domain-containing protein [Staphylococcaceae]|jgi:transcriptional regulator with XRE-family HTH domain|uniref:helix-turn-helix domain-containing protein n=1 Tax=Staphylococcaceae TaxID=90964 RepID=UPI000A1F7A82|nr:MULTISPECIES: helix-turn-helix transcriptional regulator [Staphylococcaceae]HDH4228377.1 helix-turn-helix transcriptional regulator [Staphylococcus aureus]MCH4385926.1 helix-turn-helix domain-containing protein [Staphylococcus haemolyticus]MCH4390553.1 helix-turn-helix domain-containing protein [Staphylococcus haemolyticus]MDK9856129.1 helix-turn-helix transcriptional regulator [Staphylococcus equorum]MEB6802305.1 helix-turn-helix domain-containing protein [Staphylococcus saprophyticus]